MKKNEEIIVNIEKITNTGDGLARFGEEKFVVFVKEALENEKLKVKIVSLNKHFAHAEIVEIIEPSKERIKPFCALYNACGSCQNQISSYEYQLKTKQYVLKEMFEKYTKNIFEIIKSPKTLEYRHKIQFPARETKNSKRVLLGYFKKNSHDLTNIKFCPLQPEIVNKIAQFIRENYTLGCYNEIKKTGLLKHVITRISSNNGDILITLVLNTTQDEFTEKYENQIFRFVKKLSSNFKEIKGVFVNFNPKNSNNILGLDTIKILGEDFILEKLGDEKELKTYKIGSTSFFQVNPTAASELFKVVKNNIKENSTILDAYGGVGAIGIFVSEKAKKITLVEENKNAIQMAKENFKINNIENFEILEGDAKNHILNFEKENRTFDFTILDPPRSGVSEQALSAIAKITKNIVYVSCNPITLKRDIEKLLEFNFEVQFIQGVDMFPYTSHVETVALLEKKG